MRAILLLILLAPAVVPAQGTLSGHAFDAAAPAAVLSEPAMACAVFLPADSHPFCEITAATWQQAMDALAAKKDVTTPFGRLEGGVRPTGAAVADLDGHGAFRLDALPLETRIGLAVKVDGLWWPLRDEIWLTHDAPSQAVRIPYCRLGSDTARLESYDTRVAPTVRADLKYGGIRIQESLRFTNTDAARAALVEVKLGIALVPGLTPTALRSLYGTQWMFMQGWNLTGPVSVELTEQARTAWRFGQVGAMHGQAASYGKGPQTSADNWHALQDETLLAMCGAGDTEFAVDATDGRGAFVVFRRVVPPAIGGQPGMLQLRLLHQGGARMADPGQVTRLQRAFPLALEKATAHVAQGLTLQSLIADGHRKFFANPAPDGTGMVFATAREPALESGEMAELILGFDESMQDELAQMEASVAAPVGPGAANAATEATLQLPALFKALAGLFAVAFGVALVASIRKTREKQLERLNALSQSRDEVMAAVYELESDFKAGRIHASAYVEQRARLLNRLVEADAGGK